ncbi:Na+/H+ antiporter NhaC family protein [Paenibacillus apiarius]|uniref:Sodium:proton antiporter n=1 Tax=Paenibacillus apiarius TaxID=46240 RepID=A0ABT4DPK3_9BACL|nr:Na+/H+ antiporter NhaC family protein [Paenibacillus apiarius]MCY9515650.1 sodium:proton antiporter [Paenibacillus apiarius]MCY9519277.1 sodium:proton antiporter [Paenibacillus apiarius]MCY9550913.1 sodium:proton antiporter [Paenibacillus apiarius]MCY9558995.1 sodium:proton antiporter [Paenibacillus apiarius]MCY9683528.1 sodium:proton antiporter [Paenibacillus apiarius]
MLTKRQLITVILITIAGLAAAYLWHIPLIIGFAAGFISLTALSRRQGTAWPVLFRYMREGAKHTIEVIWILIMVGLMIPVWTLSGTIPYLIEQGLQWIAPAFMTTLTFWFSALFSMLLGTSTGTLSAVGIPMMGVAAIAGVPLPLMAGALVSGAFVGDRTSPFSSTHRLVADSTGTTVGRQYPALVPTTLLGLATATFIFVLCDIGGGWSVPAEALRMEAFRSSFTFSPWLIAPAAALVVAIVLRWKTRYAFMLASVTAIIIGSWLQGTEPSAWVNGMLFGYENAALPSLHTKGVLPVIELVLLIALAGAFNGILESTRSLEPYMAAFIGENTSMPGATSRVGLYGLALALVSCTQTLPIMMAGRGVLPLWSERFPKEQLSRVVADTALVFAAIIPWNMLAVLCGTILNVPVHSYAPYAAFLWSIPLWTLLVSCLNQRRSHTIRRSSSLSS